jgi:hypothetical protein
LRFASGFRLAMRSLTPFLPKPPLCNRLISQLSAQSGG